MLNNNLENVKKKNESVSPNTNTLHDNRVQFFCKRVHWTDPAVCTRIIVDRLITHTHKRTNMQKKPTEQLKRIAAPHVRGGRKWNYVAETANATRFQCNLNNSPVQLN